MCMEDIRLGRQLASLPGKLQLADGLQVQFLPPNPRRTRLVLSADAQFPVLIEVSGLPVVPIGGFVLTIQTPWQVLRVEEYGSMLWQAWKATASGGTVTLTWIESTMEKE